MKLSAASLTFVNQAVKSTSAPESLTLTNTGPSTLTISAIQLIGGQADDFALSKTCGTTDASCMISITFTPVSAGAKSASISIADNASNSPQVVGLKGTGT